MDDMTPDAAPAVRIRGLRKDYGEKDEYHGIPTTRPNPLELFQIGKAPAKA